MQLHISFKLDNAVLPINYRVYLHGLIYRLMGMTEASRVLHDFQGSSAQRAFKGICFSPISGAHQAQGRTIRFDGLCRFELRCIDPDLARLLCENMSAQSRFDIGKARAELCGCALKDFHLSSSKVRIVPRPGIVAYTTREDGFRQYYSPADERFAEAVTGNALGKWKLYGDGSLFSFGIEHDAAVRTPKVMAEFKGSYITGWGGIYTLTGSPAVLDMLYQAGLGSKNTEGFGLFDLRD